jgi:hypothetical protein
VIKNPFYIVAPRFTNTSAGVRVLYKLCSSINRIGYSAFIYQRPYFGLNDPSFENSLVPYLTKEIRDYHYREKLTPIVVFPETFVIDKFNAPFKVKYYLNYKALLQGSEDKVDYNLAYSQNILTGLGVRKNSSVIFLPVSDYEFFKPKRGKKRFGGAYYAGKYNYHFGQKTYPITDGMIEITRDMPSSQSKYQIREIFQKVEFFYCYEDSALAIEAMLCGCPVVFLPNKYFKQCLASIELGGLGYAWGNTPEQIQHAKKTIHLARKRYIYLISQGKKQINLFVQSSQKLVKSSKYKIPFALGYIDKFLFLNRVWKYVRFFYEYNQDHGFKKLLATCFKRLKFGRLKIYHY